MNSCFPVSRGGMMAAVALAMAPFAQAKIERVVEKTFAVSAAGTLKIETSGGDIRVEPSADASVVRVVATQRFDTNSEQQADELSKTATLVIEQSGNDVSARASRGRKTSGSWWSWLTGSGRSGMRVDFKVTVPAEFAVVSKTAGGDLVIGDMAGTVNATTSGGDVRLGRLGSMVEARTSGGDIELKESAGDVRLETSGGDIEAGVIRGRARLSTSGGDIKIGTAEGELSAHTAGGDVRVGFAGTLKGNCDLGTSGGDVDVSVEKSAAFSLDARTSGGDVRDKGVVISESERRKNRLTGAVNGGGAQLKLHSSGGDITVVAR